MKSIRPKKDDYVLSVYFCGTGHKLVSDKPDHFMPYNAAYLSRQDMGYDLKSKSTEEINEEINSKNTKQFKMSFDGCGVEYGLSGMLFGSGIEEQCEQVIEQVKKIQHENGNTKLIINCYGHSRGGIAALLLAKKLEQFPNLNFEVNLALLDPVPGNLIASANLDPLDLTLANQVKSLENCKNLKNVLCLYPYEPLPDISFHAPIRPKYPKSTRVIEDIVFGCHAKAEIYAKADETEGWKPNIPAKITLPLFVKFMKACGTKFGEEIKRFCKNELKFNDDDFMQLVIPKDGETVTRSCHSASPHPAEIRMSNINGEIKKYIITRETFNVDQFISVLNDYIYVRKSEAAKQNSCYLSFFGRLSDMTSYLKIGAAKKLIMALPPESKASIVFKHDELVALRNDRLGDIVKLFESLLPEQFDKSVELDCKNLSMRTW